MCHKFSNSEKNERLLSKGLARNLSFVYSSMFLDVFSWNHGNEHSVEVICENLHLVQPAHFLNHVTSRKRQIANRSGRTSLYLRSSTSFNVEFFIVL